MSIAAWPELPWSAWSETADTLHMWTQIVGKTRLALTPLQNHWWNVPLYVTARGLSTSAMAYGDDALDIEFDFLEHELRMRLGSGKNESFALKPKSVAEFYREYQQCLEALGVRVKIWPMPVEVQKPIRFDLDTLQPSCPSRRKHRGIDGKGWRDPLSGGACTRTRKPQRCAVRIDCGRTQELDT